MAHLRIVLISMLLCFSLNARSQTVSLVGKSEEFILENVKGYASVEERGLEHEEFDVLVFEDTDRELSFYFTFFRGEKICNYIKNKGTVEALKEDIAFIKTNFTQVKDKVWENSAKTVQAEIREADGQGSVVIKEIRN